ncbi:ECF transporter S component [Brevibacterium moorei]|uniref:ECF transporter S component n=1 Tax=Brevibacterium moorei TaxID=2968457 RepID=UPI00211C3D2F|nr:ECF transporter S component [Brevibacterium sp. 68QC2CO]MCQ9386077.1 ECF transporter S component [Brevibacterium sp. 68QC2CO]
MTAEGLEHSEDESYDKIAHDLQQLRVTAGDVPYAEIVRRIGKQREARGVSPASSRPGRTTVYDAFREGRSRINTNLVCEIVEALGATEAEVATWRTRCNEARALSVRVKSAPTPESVTQPEPKITEETPKPAWPSLHPVAVRALLVALCLGINFVGYTAIAFLHLPLYLDMIGTGLAAIALGPWYGVFVGAATSVFGYSIHGSMVIPLVVVSSIGALVWGYGVRKLGFGRSFSRYFSLNVAVAVACSLIATPILVLFFNGGTGHNGDSIVHTFTSLGEPELLSVFQANLILSVVDKLLSGFIILMLLNAIGSKLHVKGLGTHDKPFFYLRLSNYAPVGSSCQSHALS